MRKARWPVCQADNSFADDFVVVAALSTSGACIVCRRRWKSARKEDIAREMQEMEKVEMVAGAMRKVCRRFLLSTAKRSLGRRYNWCSRAPDNSDDNEDKEATPRKKTMRGRGEENPEKVPGVVEYRVAVLFGLSGDNSTRIPC